MAAVSCPSSSAAGGGRDPVPIAMNSEAGGRKFSDFISLSVSNHTLRKLQELLLGKKEAQKKRKSDISSAFRELMRSVNLTIRPFSRKDLTEIYTPSPSIVKKKKHSNPIDIMGFDDDDDERFTLNRSNPELWKKPITSKMLSKTEPQVIRSPIKKEQLLSSFIENELPQAMTLKKDTSAKKVSIEIHGMKSEHRSPIRKESSSEAKPPHVASTTSMQVATSYFDPFELANSSSLALSTPLSKPIKRAEALPLRPPPIKSSTSIKECAPFGTFGPVVSQTHYSMKHKFTGISPVDDYVFLDKVACFLFIFV